MGANVLAARPYALAVVLGISCTSATPNGQAAPASSVLDFASCSGGDDTQGVLKWAAQLGPQRPGYLPAVTCRLDSRVLGLRGIRLAGGVAISGAGPRSELLITGDAPANVLVAEDAGQITLRNFTLRGNARNGGNGYNEGEAIRVELTASATAPIHDIRIEGMRLENFAADYWIHVVNGNATYPIEHGEIDHDTFVSEQGDFWGQPRITQSADAIGLDGAGAGGVATFLVTNNVCRNHWIKRCVSLWSNAHDIHIQDNTIDDAGVGLGKANVGGYAISIYNIVGAAAEPSDVTVSGNVIDNPYSAGVYIASARRLTITGNRISGQADQADETIPKAAVAVVNGVDVEISGNQFNDNFADITVDGPPGDQQANVAGLVVANNVSQGVRKAFLTLNSSPQNALWTGVVVKGNTVSSSASARGVMINSTATHGVGHVQITGNSFRVGFEAIDLDPQGFATCHQGDILVQGNTLQGSVNDLGGREFGPRRRGDRLERLPSVGDRSSAEPGRRTRPQDRRQHLPRAGENRRAGAFRVHRRRTRQQLSRRDGPLDRSRPRRTRRRQTRVRGPRRRLRPGFLAERARPQGVDQRRRKRLGGGPGGRLERVEIALNWWAGPCAFSLR